MEKRKIAIDDPELLKTAEELILCGVDFEVQDRQHARHRAAVVRHLESIKRRRDTRRWWTIVYDGVIAGSAMGELISILYAAQDRGYDWGFEMRENELVISFNRPDQIKN